MKPKTLAKIALEKINKNIFIFDKPERKNEAVKQINNVIKNKNIENIINDELEDPILEFHIGVYVPNFDYPIIPVDKNGDPIIWENYDKNFIIPGNGTHIFRGVGISGEYYYMGLLKSLAPFRDIDIKVDRYTDLENAAYAFLCTMTRNIDKDWAMDHQVSDDPLQYEWDVLIDHWKDFTKVQNKKEFEMKQKHLYIKWLQKWISKHGTNPDTHMRLLRNTKRNQEPQKI